MHLIEPYAHAAFCTGFAATGAAVTKRVQAAHDAAIRMAIDNFHDPKVLEATLQIGHMEGVWSNVFDRRSELYDSSLASFSAAWKKVDTGSDVPALVKAVRQQAGLMETKPSPTTEYAVGLVLFMLQRSMVRSDWIQLRQALSDALISGYAMGEADTLELLASRMNAGNFDFDKAFAAAKQKYENDPASLNAVDDWLNKLLNQLAIDIAKKLGVMIDNGASEQEMIDYVDQELGDGNSRTFVIVLDQMIHSAITLGILWLFRLNGVSEVWFITVGDELVCPMCDEIEAQNPYPITEPPECPAHPNCRCTLYTINDMPMSLLDGLID